MPTASTSAPSASLISFLFCTIYPRSSVQVYCLLRERLCFVPRTLSKHLCSGCSLVNRSESGIPRKARGERQEFALPRDAGALRQCRTCGRVLLAGVAHAPNGIGAIVANE